MKRHLLDAGLITRKLPEQLELVDALPRNPSGKIVKFELQARYRDGADRPTARAGGSRATCRAGRPGPA